MKLSWLSRCRAHGRSLSQRLRAAAVNRLAALIRPAVMKILVFEPRIYEDPGRVHVSPKADVINALFNTSSGHIYVGEYSFCGHDVALITGTHRYRARNEKRMYDTPVEGRDIRIGRGVWIGSNATILGPCTIGNYAVVAAGAVVLPGTEIPAGTLWAGVPARQVKTIEFEEESAGQAAEITRAG